MDDWHEHGEFVRRLAHKLVGDRHAAEDLAQDAALAALTSAPRAAARRAWFTRVVHNLSINLRRGRRRRAERERAAARPEAVSPDDVRARLEVQSRILALVGELREPYRTTVYLRFYEDLPPREIATRLGVPLDTVKTRLQRALVHLRASLDRKFGGDRKAWCAVLLPLASTFRPLLPAAPCAALLGGVAVKTAVVVGLAAIAVVLGILYLPADPASGSPPSNTDRIEPTSAAVEGVVATTPRSADLARRPLAVEPDAEEAAPTGDWILVGRVVDPSGAPLPGARIAAEMEPSRAGVATTSAADGTYRLAVDLPEGISTWASVGLHASASAPGYGSREQSAPNLRGTDERGRQLVMDFTLAPQRQARGTLVDARGDPAPGALVGLVDETGALRGSGNTAADGTFLIPTGDGGQVWMAAGSAAWGSVLTGPHDVPEDSDLDLGRTELHPHAVLEGVVSRPDGNPVTDTAVRAVLIEADDGVGTLLDQWLGQTRDSGATPPRVFAGNARGSTHTDAQGRFRLEGLAPGTYDLELPGLSTVGDRENLRRGPYRTGERARIVVESYRVHVAVVDHQDLAVPGADLTVRKGDGAMVGNVRGLDGDATEQVSPGSWVITASLEGARPAEQQLEVVEGLFDYEVELVLDFEPATGELQILVADDRGQAVRTFEVNLWMQDSSVMVADFRGLEPDADGCLPTIPTGNYKVRVTFPAQPGRSLEPGRPARLGDHFAVDAFATVSDGERATLRLTTHRGGRLRLWVEPESESHVPVTVSLDDGLGGKPRIIHTLTEQVTETRSRFANIGLGSSGFSDLLPAGSYVLRATAEGYEGFEAMVDLLPGEITELRIRMR